MTTPVRRVARKGYRCDSCEGSIISRGDPYLEHTSFPGHDSGYATQAGHPVRMRECAWCAARYQRDYLIEPIPATFQDRYYVGIVSRGLL